jgi:predicted transposase/invertase (TIGR01784 family)
MTISKNWLAFLMMMILRTKHNSTLTKCDADDRECILPRTIAFQFKTEKQLKTRLDQWLYFIKNLEDFQTIPSIFKDKVFKKAFEKAEFAKLGTAEVNAYEMNLKVYRDYKSTVDTAYDEGKLEGILEGTMKGKMEGKIEIAKHAKSMGLATKDIAKLTGLSEADIAAL